MDLEAKRREVRPAMTGVTWLRESGARTCLARRGGARAAMRDTWRSQRCSSEGRSWPRRPGVGVA